MARRSSNRAGIALVFAFIIMALHVLMFLFKYLTLSTSFFFIFTYLLEHEQFMAYMNQTFFKDYIEGIAFIVICLAIIFDFTRLVLKIINHVKHRKFVKQETEKVAVSTSPSDYNIDESSFKRGNALDTIYRKKMLLTLLDLFDNKCAKCHEKTNGLDLDHFFIPKVQGGNFAMYHNDGYWVNNAIPLCQSCNRSKSDNSFKYFFNKDEILHLFTINKTLTQMLNQQEIF